MNFIDRLASAELIGGIHYETLRLSYEPTWLGKLLRFVPFTVDYLTDGIWFYEADGTKISDAWGYNRLFDLYRTQRMRAKIEQSKPLQINVIQS